MFSSSCPCAGSFIVECQIGNAASQAKTAGQCAPRCACGKINEVRWFTTTDEHETCLKSSFHRFAHRSVGAHRADSNASKPNIDCVVGQHESRIPDVKSTRFSLQCAKKRPRVFHPGLPSFGVLTGRLARLHNLRGRQAFQNVNRALWSTLTSRSFSQLVGLFMEASAMDRLSDAKPIRAGRHLYLTEASHTEWRSTKIDGPRSFRCS